MTDETAPEPTLESLLQANQELRTELDELKEQIEAERKAVRRVGWFGLKIFVGGELRRSFRAWMNADWKPFPRNETADLAMSLVRRVVRVSLVGLAVAVLPTTLLVWQNWEIRRQSELFREQIQEQSNQHARTVQQQERQLSIVRRVQLLETIYDCAESERGEEADNEPEICPPKAHPRARRDAVRALTEIDRSDLDLASADLSGLNLSFMKLRGNFSRANFSGTSLRRANLKRVDLRRADLNGADLFRANLTRADLRGADLREANLSMANFRRADLRGVDFSNADLRGADLRNADLDSAGDLLVMIELSTNRTFRPNLTQAQINSTFGNGETKLPPGLTRPEHWLETEPEQDTTPPPGTPP